MSTTDDEESFPGQLKEYKRQEAVRLAVEVADRVLMAHANGDTRELFLVTAEMATVWLDKTATMIVAENNRLELENRMKANGAI